MTKIPFANCVFALFLLSISGSLFAADRDPLAIAVAIDRELDKKLKNANVLPSQAADDAEFLRRVYLDIVGHIPTLEKTVAFLDSKDPNKRPRLIDELLASKDFGVNFGTKWRNLLSPPGNAVKGKAPQDQFTPWLTERFNRNVSWDKIVAELVTIEGDIAKVPQTAFLMANSENFRPRANLIAASSARYFLGVRLGCAECHNHPFTSWKQTDFWGIAAFFGRLRNTSFKGPPFILTEEPDSAQPPKDSGITLIQIAPAGGIVLPVSTGKGSGQTVQARYLGGAETKLDDSKPFRPVFAEWMTSKENPYFAPAFVNRTWSHFFGRGFVFPVDDFRDNNPPTHPELLKLLADEFRDSDFDCKHLIRCICNSNAYQRTSRALPENERDRQLYSHMAVKIMSPEALYESLATMNVVNKFATNQGKTRKLDSRDDFLQLFRTQGESDDENLFRQGIPQFLKRMNGEMFNQGAPVVERLMKSGTKREQIVENLFLTALARRPSSNEIELMGNYLDRRTNPEQAYVGVLWILLSSGEFALNH